MTGRAVASVVKGRPADASERALYEEARAVGGRAYAPYSGLAVGAVLVGSSGTRHQGVNVENASYPAGVCAERVALGALVAAGEREVRAVAVAAADGRRLAPCGLCLQALAELGDPDIVCRLGAGLRVVALHELLTSPFVLSQDPPRGGRS
jgi:cytidine deaminase